MNDTSKIEHIYKISSTQIIIKCKWKSTDRKKNPWREWTGVSDKKTILTRCFVTKSGLFGKKRKGCNPLHAAMASTLHCMPRRRSIYRREKRKLKKGIVRAKDLYCKHRVLPVVFSHWHSVRIPPISPSSSCIPSKLIMFI